MAKWRFGDREKRATEKLQKPSSLSCSGNREPRKQEGKWGTEPGGPGDKG